jgi:hypothetical protein
MVAIFRVRNGCGELSKPIEQGRKTSQNGGPAGADIGLKDNGKTLKSQHHLLSVAPMMDWTDY